jgi:hypothetical protein
MIFLIDATKPMFSEGESGESPFRISLQVWWYFLFLIRKLLFISAKVKHESSQKRKPIRIYRIGPMKNAVHFFIMQPNK